MEEEQKSLIESPENPPVKRGRGRPKGSKNKNQVPWYDQRNMLVDPKTGVVIRKDNGTSMILGKIGDERVSAFVQYHMECLKMREGVNLKDVPDLYRRFYRYLAYCAEHGIIPNNMNCYLAVGVSKQMMSFWRLGQVGTPEHKRFAEDVSQFFASIHEQSATEGIVNPIFAMWQQKSHDGMIEAGKVEVINTDPLGEKKSAEEITSRYADVVLPD